MASSKAEPPRHLPDWRRKTRSATPTRSLIAGLLTAALLAGFVLSTTGVAFLALTDPRMALRFAPHDTVALLAVARAAFNAGTDPAVANVPMQQATLLDRAADNSGTVLRVDPLNAGALDLLADIATAKDEIARAVRLSEAAASLSLRQRSSTLRLADAALAVNDAPRAVERLDQLMRADLSTVPAIAPVLLMVAARPEGLAALTRTVDAAPPWRTLFLAAIPRAMTMPLPPLELFLELGKTARPASRGDTAAFLDELTRRRDFRFARYAHLQLLSPEERARGDLLRNGRFDEPSLGGPFDWRLTPGNAAIPEIVPRQTGSSDHALRLELSGVGRATFGAEQYLALAPGGYALAGAVRGELSGRRALVWRLTCAEDNRRIGETTAFTGHAEDWTPFSATFDVPADCATQRLSLQLDGRSPSEQIASGTVWYDDLTLSRISVVR